ncbi:MAG: hypothetical protein GVY36_19400 [Verrucomicrobia bacterium]|nr:hypothetical protein [Verrucomicrobiota bacterium]
MFPKFKAYIESHHELIRKRHVANKNPRSWFKTIDRIYPSLSQTPELVISDIQGEPQVAYDPGEYYPYHNLCERMVQERLYTAAAVLTSPPNASKSRDFKDLSTATSLNRLLQKFLAHIQIETGG